MTEYKFSSEIVTLPFIRGSYRYNKLIYYISKFDNIKRLYIPESLIEKVFKILYSEGYLGFKKYREVISKS